jgi:uncharacterized protein with HEPN domain
MTKDPKVFIKHILQSIILIEEYTKPLSKEALKSKLEEILRQIP